MSNPTALSGRALRPLPGDGMLARRGGRVLLCAATARSDPAVAAVLDALGHGGDGLALVRRLAPLLADAGAPPLVALGPAGAGMAVIVHGAARAVLTLGSEELVLDGRDAATYVDRMVAEIPAAVRAWLGDPADDLATREPATWARLDGGCVPAGGLLLVSPGSTGGREPDPPEPVRLVPVEPHRARAQPAPPEPRPEKVQLGDPARAADRPAAVGPPLVLGVHCKNDHFNDPGARFCAMCGISMVQRTLVARPGPRPPLGLLVLDDGATFRLDVDYVLGRAPDQDAAVAAGSARPLHVADDAGGVSRVHAKVTLDGWSVRVVDLGSANGTHLCRDGGTWQRIPPHTPVTIGPGTHVAFGRRGFRYESHRGVSGAAPRATASGSP